MQRHMLCGLFSLMLIAVIESCNLKQRGEPKWVTEFTLGEQHQVLKLHNNFRILHGGNVMKTLSWDGNLTNFAAYTGKLCMPSLKRGRVHVDHPEIAPFGMHKVGENYYTAQKLEELSIDDAFQLWIAAKDVYDSDPTCHRKMCGAYLQVMWAKTTSIGCAKVECEFPYETDNFRIFCAYWPSYEKGQAPF